MITGNHTPNEQSVYIAYLSSKYGRYCHQYNEGPDIFESVILVSDVERIFGTPVDSVFIMYGRLSNKGYTPCCDVQGKVMTVDGLKQLAARNGWQSKRRT